MLKLRMYDSSKVIELDPCDIVSVSIVRKQGSNMLLVETKEQGNLYGDWLSPADEEPIQL